MICLFRADATPSMGTGHVMRCLALAEGLRDRGHSCHFLVGEITPAVERRLRAEGVGLSRIERASDDVQAEVTCRTAADLNADLVIVDGYQFDAEWRRALRQIGRPVLSFCDHVPEGAMFADLVLSSAGDPADPALRQRAPQAQWLVGADYVLLRRELRQALAQPALPLPDRGSILVTFGGSDPSGLSLPVVRALRASPLKAPIDLVIGGSVTNAANLAAELARLGPGVRVHVDPLRMGALMRQAGLALSAAGGTLGELAAFGVPSLVAIVADNQEEGARRSAAAGWCQAVDAREGDAARRLGEAARALWADLPLRQSMAERARGIIDGRGVERVCAVLERLASTEG